MDLCRNQGKKYVTAEIVRGMQDVYQDLFCESGDPSQERCCHRWPKGNQRNKADISAVTP
jgi:hypothetical protein